MAFGKMRNKQRPSSGSYASTVTTVVFIALCVLGVWMLTSDTIVSPQTTIRTSTSTTGPDGTVMQDASKPLSKPFEDNPGDLPDDATKTGDPQKPLDPPKIEPGSDQESKPQDHPEERKEGDQSQQNPNDTSDDGRKQKDDTLPQVKEEPQQDPQQQQQAQLQKITLISKRNRLHSSKMGKQLSNKRILKETATQLIK